MVAGFVAAATKTPPGDGHIFHPTLRRLAVVWLCVTAPVAAIAGIFLSGEKQYLIGWVLGSGLYTTPALVATAIATRRVPQQDRQFWRLMFAGLVMIYCIGLAVLLLEVTGWDSIRNGASLSVTVAMLAYGVGHIRMVSSRSGDRALSVDVVEAAICAVVIQAALAVVFADRVLEAQAAWFAVPSAFAVAGMITATLWIVMLVARLGPERSVMELMGLALGLIGTIQATLQVAEGVTGFDLPQGPVIGLQCVCMGLTLLIPLHASNIIPVGMSRMPPHAQVRNGGVVTLLTLSAIPVLVIETVVLAPTKPWVVVLAGVVAITLVVLSTTRHILTLQETKRLYAQVEQAAEERRQLLARVMQGADHDRHRFAAQLHEQAASSYAAFVSFINAMSESRDGVPAQVAGASAKVRDDLSRQAEELRQLMLAIRPLESSSAGSGDRLAAPIAAYVDSLYGDTPAPELTIEVNDELVLDWNTETIVFRIVQEAVRNVWCHAKATELHVALDLLDDVVEVRVSDDGIGFDPDSVMFEPGWATIRTFAGLMSGSMTVESELGRGTTLTARLRTGLPRDPSPGSPGETEPVIDLDGLSRPQPPRPRERATTDVDAVAVGVPGLRLLRGGADRDRADLEP